MLHYDDTKIKNAISFYDQFLRGLERDAQLKEYPIDTDATYTHACEMITNIEMHKGIEPELENWMMLGYYIGMVRSRILNYKGKT